MQNTASVGVRNNASKVGSSIVAHASAQDNGLGVAIVKELEHIGQREGAADVGIENEEALGSALEDSVAEVVEATCGTEGLILAEVLDGGEDGEFLAGVLDEVAEDGLVVIADDVDILDGANGCDGGDAVPDDGVAGDFEERLGDVEGKRAETGTTRRTADLGQLSASMGDGGVGEVTYQNDSFS